MDLNDPRRRLQVLNNSNPSLRVATAPQQQPTISVSNKPVNQPQISVPQAPQQVQQQPVNNKLKGFTMDQGKNKTIFGWNAAALLPKSLEKTYGIKADREIDLDHNTFLTQYDKLDEQFRNVYTNQIMDQAKNGDAAALNTLKLLTSTGRTKGNANDFMAGANDKLYGGIGRGILRGTDFLLPGVNTFGLEQLANEQDPSKTGTAQFTTAGKVGEKFGSVEKGIFDLATLAAGGGAAEQAATKVPAFAGVLDKLSKGGKVSQLAGRMLQAIPGSLAGSGISSVQTAGKGDEQNFGKDLAIGTAVDLGLPILGSGYKGLKNLFKSGADDAVSHGIIKDLIDEVDPVKIEKALGIDKEMATYLAQETNPDTVKEVLRQMDMDPNIQLPDAVRKRLEEEGISAVRKKDNQYGAEYDPNDSSISFKDQSFATDANTYHELGHHIFKNKLTPEEQALFKGTGEASQKAAGREGYTPADVNSEDFSDYMQKALTGRIKEVPEELRPVIAKYAKTAANEAEDLGIAGAKAVDAPAPQAPKPEAPKTAPIEKTPQVGKPDPTAALKQEALKYKSAGDFLDAQSDKFYGDGGDQQFLTSLIDKYKGNGKPGEKGSLVQYFTPEERARYEQIMSPENNLTHQQLTTLYNQAHAQPTPTPEQAVGDVSKAQTGVSDAAPDGSVKTTSLEDAGTTFADNYNGNLKKPTPTPQVTKTPTVDPTAALKQEALKYKSAEEFVNSKTNAYHGSDNLFDEMQVGRPTKRRLMFGEYDTTSEGMFFAPDEKVAREFGENVGKYYVDVKKPLVFSDRANDNFFNEFDKSIENVKDIEIKPGESGFSEWMYLDGELGKRFKKFAKSKGFDGAKIDEVSEFTGDNFATTVAFENNQVKSTKQLTDLYNQATQSQPPKSPLKTETLYHGSDRSIDKFNVGEGMQGRGVYLTNDTNRATMYGSRGADGVERTPVVNTVKANIKNPLISSKVYTRDMFGDTGDVQLNKMLDTAFDAYGGKLDGENLGIQLRVGQDNSNLEKLGFDAYKSSQDTVVFDPKNVEVIKPAKSQSPLANDAPQVTKTEPTTVYHGGTPQKAEEIVPNADDETKRAVQEVLDNLNGAQKNFDDAAKIRTQQKAARINSADGAFQSAGAKPTVDEMFPNMSSEGKALVQETMDSLEAAQTGYTDATKLRQKQTAQRSQAGNAAFDAAGGGQAGFRAEMAAQRGKKAASTYEPIVGHQAAKDEIINDIKAGSDQMDWEKRNTINAFQKMWGDIDGQPTPSDIKKIKNYYNSKQPGLGDDVAQLLDNAGTQQDMDLLEQIAGAPRTFMTIGDASAPRQLAVSFARHPIVTTKAYLKSFAHMFSGRKFSEATEAMESMVDSGGRNYAEFMDSVMNIHLPNVAERAAEESMSSTPLLSKIPVVGRVVDASNRGMSSAVARTRFELAKKFIDDAGGIDEVNRLFSQRELEELGEVFNTITGRGGKKGGFTDRHATILSKTLFSGKLWASRMNMLNPYWYYRLSGPARKEALSSAASFAATAGVVLTLIDQATGDDVEVGTNPLSADFGKVKIGNTRYDITGGFVQYPRIAAQILAGKKVSSTSGEERDTTAGSVLGQLAEGKMNPLLGYAWTLLNTSPDDEGKALTRENEFGEDINVVKKAGELLLPLPISEVADNIQDKGSFVKGFGMALPGFFGAGVQTYGETATKDQKTDSKGKIAFGGKIQDNMVLDNDGNVMMDEKNRPIKVKFDKNATETQKAAAKKKAQNEAYTKKAKSLLSQEDADLYATGQADPNSLDQAQKDKFDQIKKWVSDYGKSVDIPKSVKSDAAKNFYAKYNTMTKKDQENWLKESPDENAKTVATELNKQRVKGLPEYKPSNYLSKEYAEYEKDLLEHPEYTNIDKQNKARAFQTKAYKYNYSEDQRDIFNEGGSSDLKSLIDDGQVSKADLDAAIKLDEELYNSGLTGSLKFSKKFRNTYGYGTPAGRGGSGSGGSGGGSGSGESKRAYLSAYVSNGTEGAKKEAPQFSSKRRTQGISFKDVSTPKKSNSKKVTINL